MKCHKAFPSVYFDMTLKPPEQPSDRADPLFRTITTHAESRGHARYIYIRGREREREGEGGRERGRERGGGEGEGVEEGEGEGEAIPTQPNTLSV